MARLFLFIGVFVFLSQSVFAIEQTQHENLRQLIASREYSKAVAELEGFKAASKEKFELNNYDFLLGRIYERLGNFALAAANYHNVSARNSILRDRAHWQLAELSRFSGNALLERIYLQELRFRKPQSLYVTAASNRIARSYLENGNFQRAINELRSLQALRSKETVFNRLARSNLSMLAEALIGTGYIAAAREVLTQIIDQSPNKDQPDDFTLRAANELDRLDLGSDGTSVPKLSAEEHLKRANIYQFNRSFDMARLHYLTIVNDHSNSQLSAVAGYQIGRGFTQQNAFAEAVKWYERVLEQFPETEVARDAVLQLGSAYARVGKYRESAARYQIYIDRFPIDERLDRAYLNMIDIARDLGEENEAIRRAQKTQEIFRGKTAEAQALFAEARIYLANENWTAAEDALRRLLALQDLGGTRVPGGTDQMEIRFLIGTIQEKTLRYNDAIETYLSIPDGRASFYGWQATERLAEMARTEITRQAVQDRAASIRVEGTPATRKNALHSMIRLTVDDAVRERLLNELKAVYSELPEYSVPVARSEAKFGRPNVIDKPRQAKGSNIHADSADELLFLGLYDEAAAELEASGKVTDPVALAQIYAAGNGADRAVGFAESFYKIPADYHVKLLPKDVTELLYPTPFVDELLESSASRSVDPRLLLAIMRQESRFRPTVKSNASARGLMQFIPSTSTRIAGELQRSQFEQDDLYDPSVAILFGSQYVSGLFKLYPNQPAAVAASYNGGEDNMKRWKTRARSDRYVPEIMYSQSKDYVFKVMSSYRVYQTIYDEKLSTR